MRFLRQAIPRTAKAPPPKALPPPQQRHAAQDLPILGPVTYTKLGNNGDFRVDEAETSHGTMDFESLPVELQEQARQLVAEDIAWKSKMQS
jgi:hypothetical protein